MFYKKSIIYLIKTGDALLPDILKMIPDILKIIP